MSDESLLSGSSLGRVWPPPVPGFDASGMARPIFRSQSNRTRWILAFIWLRGLTLVLAAVTIPLATVLHGTTALILVSAFGYAFSIALVGLAILYLFWIRDTYFNLDAFRTAGKSTSAGGAVGYYFLPFVDLYRPYRNVIEVWRASDPNIDSSDKSAWSKGRVPGLLLGWWLLYLFFCIATMADNMSQNPALTGVAYPLHPDLSYVAGRAGAVAAVGIVALIAMWRVVKMVNERQEAKEAVMQAQDEATKRAAAISSAQT